MRYTCAVCSIKFDDRPSKQRLTCSRSCGAKYRLIHSPNFSYAANGYKQKFGKDNPNWKGQNVKYFGLHMWIRRNWGHASKCEHCEISNAKQYDWSMKIPNAGRDRNNWQELCRSCHMKYDYANGMRR